MRFSARLQLTCLLVYVTSAHAIMVKYGTKGGPIEPPPPEPELPPPRHPRAPAPVWEARSNDVPDPNAQWRPQLFVPQPRFTQVAYDMPPLPPLSLNNAQRFVNAYVPVKPPVNVQPVKNFFTASQFLSSQPLPGFGLRYFIPDYVEVQKTRQDDAKHNNIEINDVDGDSSESASDLQWKYEKDATKRTIRDTQERAATAPLYQWPLYELPGHR